jgi:hypothetical protein
LKDHWPFLLTGEGFLEHFTRLMGFDLTARFQEHFSAKERLPTSYAKRNGNDEVSSLAAKLKADSKVLHNDLPLTFGSLLVLKSPLERRPDAADHV